MAMGSLTVANLPTGVLAQGEQANLAKQDDHMLIIDTHQHLRDLSRQTPPWLESAPEVLRRNYTSREYQAATEGLHVEAIYMEVDVAPADHMKEAQYVVSLCEDETKATVAAVIGGRPSSERFTHYLDHFKDSKYVKGVRQVLHVPETKPGYCLRESFVAGTRALGERGLRLDLCMRPMELNDGAKLIDLCPDTNFIVDHCGNADPKAFRKDANTTGQAWHDPDEWKRDMENLANFPNVICKISGILARAPKDWSMDDLAPIVNHCIDMFGEDRIVFGGDWPVCLLGASLLAWVSSLRQIVSTRSDQLQRKLWHENAQRYYKLPV